MDLSGVVDANNLVMVSLIGKNLPNQPIGALCGFVGTDDYAFTGHYMPITGDDPCTLGTEPIMFDPGTYSVIVAALPGGSTTPHQCARAEVDVDGDVSLEVVGLSSPTDCGF